MKIYNVLIGKMLNYRWKIIAYAYVTICSILMLIAEYIAQPWPLHFCNIFPVGENRKLKTDLSFQKKMFIKSSFWQIKSNKITLWQSFWWS